jgi:ADP-ribose pyrophosphatase YjhB (NUDIX family)
LIIESHDGIILIKRRNPPAGWALPGGFVEYGESIESAAMREAREETGMEVELVRQFHTYSDPARDPRHHTITTVFIARAKGRPSAGDDAKAAGIFRKENLPEQIAFDHREIINDYYTGRY